MSPLDQDTDRERGFNNSHIFGNVKREFVLTEEAIRRGQARRKVEELKAQIALQRELNYL